MVPAKMGFRMPAEWEPRERTFMAWPVRTEIWPDGLKEAQEGYARIAREIAAFEEVVMLVQPHLADEAGRMCGAAVEILPMEHDDSWLRDNGPTFLINGQGELAAVNWQFNAWGGKYQPYDQDNAVAGKLLARYGVPVFEAPLVLEGGSIHVDGEGTLMTTEQCLLNKNRNPQLGKREIERLLGQYLAVDVIFWLKQGLAADETDGHVDNVACFVRPGVIAIQACHDPADLNYSASQENLKLLADFTDAQGRRAEVVQIEQPPVRYWRGQRLSMSYLNYYPVNGGIIVPVFGGDAQATDEAAVRTLQRLYPDRKIVPVDGMPIIKGGGNVHCITQQMPAGIPARL
ncbi:agmatine deiminase|uniref:Putative agmatine deiminase n=1 Tax=Dendrosporobacter quercicolus TaxID=146817 RepID=A0A1G9RIQ7_9FIRM|nr:agmatine deiminase [Dendrosporobacter quercicolus]NSL49434.1 agmatine deiminase [Dendrosporobacter quercicolus DSM 1736]SDM23202.1 agmatine deiminase [Dendrosporobacter quercicolus]